MPALPSLAAYLAVFAVMAHRWWATAATAVPLGADPRDSRLILWILGSVATALGRSPAGVFDAPIYFPARRQLAGSEHLLTSQLVFAPVLWIADNPVLAANVVAWLSYPLAAFAMARLLVAQGVGGGASWVAGLSFALGVWRVPASVHVLQYLVVFLPVTALRLQRLRERPGPYEGALLAACLLAGLFASYYLAVLVLVTAALWGAFELARPGTGRRRFVVVAGAAVGVAVLVLAAASIPYFGRAPRPLDVDWALAMRVHLDALVRDPLWLGLVGVGLVGALGALRAGGSDRALACAGVAFVGAGIVLAAVGWPNVLEPWFGFFRLRPRYLLLSSFGLSLLVGLGADRLVARWPPAVAAALLAAGAVVLVAMRTPAMAPRVDEVRAVGSERTLYRQLGAIAQAQGSGALLEMPSVSNAVVDDAAEAMVGQLEHGLPIVTGFTGYPPAHHALLRHLIAALPAQGALADLVDLTHVRWILVRPAEQWPTPGAREQFVAGLVQSGAAGPSWAIGPWVLWRLDRSPEHSQWFDALARGAWSGESVLGSPRRVLGNSEAIAVVTAAPAALRARPGGRVVLDVVARNAGTAAWPTWDAAGWDGPGLVTWTIRWRSVDGSNGWGPESREPLRRDVPAGEAIEARLAIAAPERPGTYDVAIGVRQRDGAAFAGPPNRLAIGRVTVAP